jgi:hypothetical protein
MMHPGMMHETEDVGTGEDLARFLSTDQPWTRQLLQLVATAEPVQRAKLRVAFPAEVITWEIWGALEEIPSAGDLRALVSMVWPPAPGLGIPPVESVAAMVTDYKHGRVALPARARS